MKKEKEGIREGEVGDRCGNWIEKWMMMRVRGVYERLKGEDGELASSFVDGWVFGG